MRKDFLNIVIIGFLVLNGVLLFLLSRNPGNEQIYHIPPAGGEKTVVTVAKQGYRKDSRFASLIHGFNQENDHNIRIEVVEVSDSEYQMELNLLMTSSKAPDIVNIESDWIRTYINKRWLQELDPFIEEEILDEESRQVLEYVKRYSNGGRIYAYPTSLVTYRLLYNAALLKALGLDGDKGPEDLQEFVAYVRHMSQAGRENSIYGFALGLKDVQQGFRQNLEAPATRSGIHYYDPNRYTVDFSVYRSWFEAIGGLIEEKSILPGYETVDMNLGLTQFAEGNIGMIYVSSDDYPMIRALYQGGEDWRIVLPPYLEKPVDGGKKLMMSYGDFYGITRRTPNVEAAAIVWEYLCSEAFIQQLYEEGEILPISGSIRSQYPQGGAHGLLKRFLPTEEDQIFPLCPAAVEDQHRFRSYFDCLNQAQDIEEILEKETYYMKQQLKE